MHLPGDAHPLVLVLCHLDPEVEARLVKTAAFLVRPNIDTLSAPDTARVAVVVVRSETWVNDRLLDRFPALKFVIRAGSGLDRVDQRALARRGIALVRNAAITADAVAEFGVASLVAMARRMPLAVEQVRRGQTSKEELVGDDVRTLKVCIWGAGPVGQAIRVRLGPLCEDVAFIEWPSVPPDVPTISVDAALADRDVHMLALPYRPTTHLLFSASIFERMRPMRPYLVNVARFNLVDVAAVVAALGNGALRGVALDAVDPHDLSEVHAATSQLDAPVNLIVSPHIAAQRADVKRRLAAWVVETVNELLGATGG